MICKNCNLDKSLDDYQEYKKRNGTTGHRLTCRKCRNTRYYEVFNDKFKEKAKEWSKANKDKKDTFNIEHLKKERKNRPWRTAMKNMLYRKDHRMSIYNCGYTYDEFKIYIEKLFDDKMSWDNWGDYWDIDHIKPRTLFTFEERFECNSLNNLQPLEKSENRYIKRDKYNEE